MLLNLKKVFLTEDEKLNADYELDLHELDFNGTHPFLTPVKVSANAVNRAGVVNLAVTAAFDYTAPCDRCGEETITSFCRSFNHTLVQSLVGENEGEYIETPDFMLELDEAVTTDILLDLPSKHLCKEDCRGLCQKCGANLNKEKCTCDTREIDPRLEALKSLL
ncbi:MAG: DUF177 domain-containing protein [Clostridia bacterium]|nr:DUF177 domain-containing protein [Clostridia bacterium]